MSEKAIEALRGNVGGNARGKDAGARLIGGLAVDIGGKDLDFVGLREVLETLLNEDGDGIGFFAGGTTADPNTYGATWGHALEEARNSDMFQRVKGIAIAEKTGHADE